MTKNKTLTLDELLNTLRSDLNDLKTRYYQRQIPDVMTFSDLQDLAVEEARQQFLQWVADEVVSQDELHVSHVCPPGDIGCAKFAQRGATRNHQLKILKAAGWKPEGEK